MARVTTQLVIEGKNAAKPAFDQAQRQLFDLEAASKKAGAALAGVELLDQLEVRLHHRHQYQLRDALADGDVDVEQLVIRTDVGGLSILPAGTRTATAHTVDVAATVGAVFGLPSLPGGYDGVSRL